MQEIGRVVELWRYPVSSLAGEMLDRIDVSPAGISGDRGFALFDRSTGQLAAPEQAPRWRPALNLTAAHHDGPVPTIALPGHGHLGLSDPRLVGLLTDHFGFDVGIAAYSPRPEHETWQPPVVTNRYEPSPLHLLTTASLASLARMGDLDPIDRRRFRPSVLIETDDEGFFENDWPGKTVMLGTLPVAVTERTRRCGMTLIAQPGITEEPEVLRSVMRHNGRSLGVYARPLGAGIVVTGDRVYAQT
jgi:uncharacterized protein YcbX